MPIGRSLLSASLTGAIAISCAAAKNRQNSDSSNSSQSPQAQPQSTVSAGDPTPAEPSHVEHFRQPAPSAPSAVTSSPSTPKSTSDQPPSTPSAPSTPRSTPTPMSDNRHERDHDHDHDRDRHHNGNQNRPIEIIAVPDSGFFPPAVPMIPIPVQPPVAQQPNNPPVPTPVLPATLPADPVVVAQSRLDRVTAELQRQFEQTPEFRAAVAELRGAQAAYDQTLIAERQSIKSDPAYQEALAEKDRASKAVAAAWRPDTQSSPSTQPTEVTAAQLRAAQAKLAAAKKLTDLENKSLDDKPNVVAARQRITTAKARLDKLQADHVATLADNPIWQTAQRLLDSARLTAALGPTP